MASFDIPQLQQKVADLQSKQDDLIRRIAALEHAQSHYGHETDVHAVKIGLLKDDVAILIRKQVARDEQ